MIKGLTELVSGEVVLGILAASGGIARVVAGVSPNNTSFVGEFCRIIFCAMPVGIMSGMYVQSIVVSPVLPLASSFAAGVVSLNIIRFLTSDQGLKILRTLIGGGKL